MARRAPFAAVSICLALLLAGACASEGTRAGAASSGRSSAPSTSRSPVSATVTPPATPPVTASSSPRRARPVVFRPPPGGSFLVKGSYPPLRTRCKHPKQPRLVARYPGTLSVARSAAGTLTITVRLPFERYIEGIAEVPPSWPMAALEAQAVAARSYALATTGWSGVPGARLGTTICGTAACQVYAGIPVRRDPGFRRWRRAVHRTRGLVLVYGGRPADTVYFSTSNGHTYGNDQVFGSAPLPYLRPVRERDDGASPESHWRVTIPTRDLATFLRRAGSWPRGHSVARVSRHGDTVVIAGGGTRRAIGVADFRDAVNTWAPCLYPHRYPAPSRFGTPLPVTIPSDWYRMTTSVHAVTLTGRGWGHGVGMVQWGAFGKAKRGLTADQILAYYYGGLTPQRYPEPAMIRVEVATGLTRLRVIPSTRGARVDGRPMGRRGVTMTRGSLLRAGG